MSAFVHPHAPSMGDFVYGSHLDIPATTPYLMIPPSSRMSTASPISGNNTTYQPTPSQMPANSFFEEAIDGSPPSIEGSLGSSFITSPTQSIGSNIAGTPHYMLPLAEDDKRLNQWAFDRRESQASSAFSETSASGPAPPKPRKRGRKPKKQPKEQAVTGQEDELDDDDLPKDPRRRRILERNRIAATKCRLRKRDEASALASREQVMEDQNRYLSNCFDSLTAEIYHLKTQLLRHTDCNCVLIQRYIANEAKKSVDGLVGCSSAFHQYGDSLSPEYISASGSSSSASTAESLHMHSPESDSVHSAWPSSFQHGPRTSDISENMFDLGIEPFQKAGMPPDRMITGHSYPGLPLSECGQGLYISMGPHDHQVNDGSWDSHWGFDNQGRISC